MIRTKNAWQEYVEENINIKQLMRHRGYVAGDDLEKFVENGLFLVGRVAAETGIATYDNLKILDVGCANGRFPIALDALGYHIKGYVGTDVMLPPIEFLRTAFRDSHLHEFDHVQAQNDRYTPQQGGSLFDVELPGSDYDLIVCNSLFTHLGHPVNAEDYLRKMSDALSRTGRLYATWFKSPPNKQSFAMKRTVYKRQTVYNLYGAAKLTILAEYGGDTTSNQNQWRLVARRM